jgi:hypothetical protein
VTAGTLTASPVCSTNIHLNRTDVSFSGALSGTWESTSGFITASWTGGDYACDGTHLTAVDGYPTSGSLTISMTGTVVSLQRIINNAEPYQFTPTNQRYTPPAATCVSPPAADSGARDSSLRDVGPSDGARDVSPLDSSSDSGIYDSGARDSASDLGAAYDGSVRDASMLDGSGRDASSDALGPVCSKLALCCPTITDLPALQQQCGITLSNGLGDPGCQITWDTLVRLGYCAGIGGP